MATPVLICGAECGQIVAPANTTQAHWTGISGTVAVETSIIDSEGGTQSFKYTSKGYHYRNISSNVVVVSTKVRQSANPGLEDRLLQIANPYAMAYIKVTTAGNLRAYIGTTYQEGPSLGTTNYKRIDLRFNTSANPYTLDWSVDGVEQTQVSVSQTASNNTLLYQGAIDTGAVHSVYIDGTVISYTSDDYPLDLWKVLSLSPSSDGTHSFTLGDFKYYNVTNVPVDATDCYSYVDDKPISDLTDYIMQSVIRTDGYLAMNFENMSESVNAMGVNFITALKSVTSTGANLITQKITSDDWVNSFDLYTDYDCSYSMLCYPEQVMAIPTEGGTWTQSKLNALSTRWGYSGDVIPVNGIYGMIAEVAYAVSGAAAYSLTANPGSFSLSGASIGAIADRLLSASPASISLTGYDAGTFAGRVVSASPGAINLSGASITALVDRMLSASPGAIVLTGFDADLVYVVPGAYVLDAMPGVFVLTGADAAAIVGRVLVANPGVFQETGFSTTELVDRVLSGQIGVYVLSGYDAALEPPGAPGALDWYQIMRRRRR